jgi:uncharacterized DUF497 family protein
LESYFALRINRIIIPGYVLDKLQWKHHVSEDEVYDTLARNPKLFFVERGKVQGEDVYRALGQTSPGRYLSIFFIYKASRDAIVISARDMSSKERKRYDKK